VTSPASEEPFVMAGRRIRTRWLSVQETAAILCTTSAEVCRLISLGRLTGLKRKVPGRPGKAQWSIDPRSIAGEKKRNPKRWREAQMALEDFNRRSMERREMHP
jgi:hypothetical protein